MYTFFPAHHTVKEKTSKNRCSNEVAEEVNTNITDRHTHRQRKIKDWEHTPPALLAVVFIQ